MVRNLGDYGAAIEDFRAAHNRAILREILSRFTGPANPLLSFDEVRRKLRAGGSLEKGLQDVPLDAIVGSVGRYADFTRDFLPLQGVSEDRWARVRLAATDLVGLPPIEVYKIGEAYFVKDGNHRVSVARQLGAKEIQAYVTEITTRVPLTPDTNPDDLILKAELADFLESTHLDQLRPDADLSVTAPGKYADLLEHIAVHQYYMGIDFQREVPFQEAVTHWYDTVYLPIVQIIRDQGILRFFPNRTETDPYLWIAEHRTALQQELGWSVDPAAVATHLAESQAEIPGLGLARMGEKLLGALSPDTLEAGPPTGSWRQERESLRKDRLFNEILVPVSGEPQGWFGFEQALVIARREDAVLHGLHVVPTQEQKESQAVQEIIAAFNRRCAEAGVRGELVAAVGTVPREISSRARWTDLVVTNLAYPPGARPLARLSSGFRTLVQRCPVPLLATPGVTTGLEHALLAFDGSPKAEEALYIGAYLAWRGQVRLDVLSTSKDERLANGWLDQARSYLESCGVEASFHLETSPVAETVLRLAGENGCDLIIMGGYGYRPLLEVMLGSALDGVLRESTLPVLICR